MGYMFTRGHRLSAAFAAFAVLALATPAAAIADADERIQWNGFLNVVGGILHQEGFSADNPDGEVPQRLNYTDDFSFDRETSAGLQASTALDDRTHITAQLYANGADENYAAAPVTLSAGKELRNDFDALVLNKTTNQVRAYWAQQIFTGRGTPPRELASEDDIVRHVARHPDAVGYVSAGRIPPSVKPVLVLDGGIRP